MLMTKITNEIESLKNSVVRPRGTRGAAFLSEAASQTSARDRDVRQTHGVRPV
jgi:hypothetical protein